MSDRSDRSYASAIAPLAGDATAGHPTPDRLVAYQRGGLDPATEEAVREHLADCADCTALVLDLDAFAAADNGEPTAADFETATAWRALAPRLAEDGAADPGAGAGRPARARHGAWVAAAALALACLGLGSYAVWTTGGGPAVEADLPILYLDQAIRGGTGTEGPAITLAENGYVALVVLPPPEHAGEPLAAWLVSQAPTGEEREVWRGTLTPSPEGGLRLGLPASALPPGMYRLRLFEPGQKGRADHGPPVEEYPFSIVAP